MDGMEIQRTLLLGYVSYPQAKSYRNQRLLKKHQNISIQNAVTLSKNIILYHMLEMVMIFYRIPFQQITNRFSVRVFLKEIEK